MDRIPVCRAAHLIPFTEVLRELGAPVDRELARAKLPTCLENNPDIYIGLMLGLDFVARCEHLEDLHDLGWLAAKGMHIGDLSADYLFSSQHAPTLYERLAKFTHMAVDENSTIKCFLAQAGEATRAVCNLGLMGRETGTQQSEWIQIMALVAVIRSGAGRDWTPSEITFRSDFQPSDAALEHFGNTRILVGQENTSITAPTALLSVPVPPLRIPACASGRGAKQPIGLETRNTASLSTAETLRRTIRPYLGDRFPSIALAAEISGTSERTLQRRLKNAGTSYVEIVEHARFEVATKLLADLDTKIIDVAFATGYQDPSHFSRAFRKISGMSPREFRANKAVLVQ